jgi:hypothetical protein
MMEGIVVVESYPARNIPLIEMAKQTSVKCRERMFVMSRATESRGRIHHIALT